MAKKKATRSAGIYSRPFSSGVPRVRPLGKPAVPAELLPIVERMRKAEAEDAATENDTARECGAEWAKYHARPRQLTRLEPAPDVLAATPQADMGKAFVSLVNGLPADWDETREFFENYVGASRQEEWDTPGFVEAFAAGALGVWQEVKAHVQAA